MRQTVDIAPENLEADTSSYHCRYAVVCEMKSNEWNWRFILYACPNDELWFMCLRLYSVVRDLSLEQIDPSLAIGFYCRDKGEPL